MYIYCFIEQVLNLLCLCHFQIIIISIIMTGNSYIFGLDLNNNTVKPSNGHLLIADTFSGSNKKFSTN